MDVPGFVRLLKRQDLNSEVWWDSSPDVYTAFKSQTIGMFPELRGFIENLLPSEFGNTAFGISGATTNPKLIAQAVLENPEPWRGYIVSLPVSMSCADKARRLYEQVVAQGARQLHALWMSSQHRHGWLSAQIEGEMTEDAMVARGLQLSALAPNIMIKVPGSEPGYRAIERLVALGCSVNNTLCFTVSQAAACLKAIRNGRLRAQTDGVSTEHARYVISFMIGRLGAEAEFERQAARKGAALTADDRRWAELAVYQAIQALLRRTSTPARLLLCSLKLHTDGQGREQCWHLQRTGFDTTLYTMTPQIIEFLIRREQQRRPVRPASGWVQVPPKLMTRLMAIPYFHQAYFEGDLLPSEFVCHPAFVTASRDARDGERRLLAFVKAEQNGASRAPTSEAVMEELS